MENPALISLAALRRYPLLITVGVDVSSLLADWRREVFIAILANLLVIGALAMMVTRDVRLVAALYRSNDLHRADAEALRRSEERVTLATTSAGIGVWELDLKADALRWDAVQCRLFGLSITSFTGSRSDWVARVDGEDLANVERIIAEARSTGRPYSVEYRILRPDGERRIIRSAGVFHVAGDGTATQEVGVCWDVTDMMETRRRLEEANKALSDMAFYDALTGLANRRYFLERLVRALRTAERQDRMIAVLFIDLNRFKELNDTHGHEAGDQLLTEVARRLKLAVREIDAVARLGGDEFVILLEGLDPDPNQATAATEAVVAKIHLALGEPYTLGAIRHSASASVGVKVAAGRGETPERVLREADKAMYEAKRRLPPKTA